MADNEKINPYYIAGGLAVLVIAGTAYWYFTKKEKSDLEEAAEKSAAEPVAGKSAEVKSPIASSAKDFSQYNTSISAYPSAPKTAGKRSVGDSIIIRACVKPRRLNEKLEYVEDATSKSVAVKLGSLWGWAGADHVLITTGGKAAPNIIVKSDDMKIAPFYEVSAADVQPSDIGILEKVKDKSRCMLSADGFEVEEYHNNIGFAEVTVIEHLKGKNKKPVSRYYSHDRHIGSDGFSNDSGDFGDVSIIDMKQPKKAAKQKIEYSKLLPHNSWKL